MKITGMAVRSFCGVRSLKVGTPDPLTLFGGHNGAGKSSLCEAIAIALTNDPVRVSAKGDYPLMLADGAKDGMIALDLMIGEVPSYVTMSVPLMTQRITGAMLPPVEPLRCVTDIERFVRMSADDRRTLLFHIMQVPVTPNDVEVLLLDRGVTKSRAQQAASMMLSGFPAACEYARDKAKDARSAWRGFTGEVYGAKKAESWRAADTQYDPAMLEQYVDRLAVLTPDLEQAHRDLGALEERQRAREHNLGVIHTLRARVAKLELYRDKLASDQGVLDELEASVTAIQTASNVSPKPMACPHCGGVVVERAGGLEAYAQPEAVVLPRNAAELATILQQRAEFTQAVRDGRDAIALAEQAAITLADLAEVEPVDAEEIDAARNRVTTIKQSHDYLSQQRLQHEQRKVAAADAAQKTLRAADHHFEASEWTTIAGLLAPDGLPAELLQTVIAPFNGILAEFAKSTGFAPVTLTPDLDIRAGGRPYGLLSGAEKWRVQAFFAVAIAHYSGIRLVLLDRFDVLDAGARAAALDWLAELLVESTCLECALVFCTARALPPDEPGIMRSYWIERGHVIEPAVV
jgi:AAA domain